MVLLDYIALLVYYTFGAFIALSTDSLEIHMDFAIELMEYHRKFHKLNKLKEQFCENDGRIVYNLREHKGIIGV